MKIILSSLLLINAVIYVNRSCKIKMSLLTPWKVNIRLLEVLDNALPDKQNTTNNFQECFLYINIQMYCIFIYIFSIK